MNNSLKAFFDQTSNPTNSTLANLEEKFDKESALDGFTFNHGFCKVHDFVREKELIRVFTKKDSVVGWRYIKNKDWIEDTFNIMNVGRMVVSAIWVIAGIFVIFSAKNLEAKSIFGFVIASLFVVFWWIAYFCFREKETSNKTFILGELDKKKD